MTVNRSQLEALVDQLGMEGVIRFEGGIDCLYRDFGAIHVLYRPRTKRMLGGTPKDRMLHGDIGFVLSEEIHPTTKRKRQAWVNSIALCPITNFPHLIREAPLIEDRPSPQFAALLKQTLDLLPRSRTAIANHFGEHFLERPRIERVSLMVLYFKAALSPLD